MSYSKGVAEFLLETAENEYHASDNSTDRDFELAKFILARAQVRAILALVDVLEGIQAELVRR